MALKEYTPDRAKKLYLLSLPKNELNVRFIWFDAISSDISSIYLNSHSHSFYEIHFNFSEKSVYECDKETVVLNRNEALFLSPQTKHKFVEGVNGTVRFSLAVTIDGLSDIFEYIPKDKYKIFTFSESIEENINFILK